MAAQPLILGAFWLSESQLETIDQIAISQNISGSEVLRLAIDQYSQDHQWQNEVFRLLRQRLVEAIAETKTTNEKIESLLS